MSNKINKIKSLIENNQIYPVYQAILDNNDEIRKCEILARLEYQDTNPEEFIQIAKDTNCYNKITESIIKKAFPYLSKIKGLNKFSINMNLTDINNKETKKLLKQSIITYNLKDKVIIELTEDEDLTSQKAAVVNFMNELSKEPFLCEFALDDFGKGYATFEPLLSFNFKYIKLDAILTKTLTLDAKRYYLVDMLKNMAERLSIQLVAEHIGARPNDEENEEELYEAVKLLNIDYLQGFFIHQPSKKLDLNKILLEFQTKIKYSLNN